jgi:hypothetical protein
MLLSWPSESRSVGTVHGSGRRLSDTDWFVLREQVNSERLPNGARRPEQELEFSGGGVLFANDHCSFDPEGSLAFKT